VLDVACQRNEWLRSRPRPSQRRLLFFEPTLCCPTRDVSPRLAYQPGWSPRQNHRPDVCDQTNVPFRITTMYREVGRFSIIGVLACGDCARHDAGRSQ
jgi:hypothetical protein